MSGNKSDNLDRLEDIAFSIVKGLVDNESAVRVVVTQETFHTNIQVFVDPSDFGKVVGAKGHLVNSMRHVLRSIGNKLKLPMCSVIVEDPRPDKRGIRRSYDENSSKERY